MQRNNHSKRIVILDGPRGELAGLREAFAACCGEAGSVESVAGGGELLERLGGPAPCDLAVIDYHLGDGERDGLAVLAEIRERDPELPVVMVAERGDVETATRAVKAGATDFLVRSEHLPERVSTQMVKIRHLLSLVEKNRALREQNQRLREAAGARYRIVGRSPQILEVIERVERVAAVPRPVLITGERGTGKELVARAIHAAAGPLTRPFVTVNCAAFAETLLESELFGHEKGAFTGAEARSRGRFEQADGGTLFLDEIGNMSLPFQQKILRVVEYGTFARVGGRQEIRVNARIIAATNADLEKMMEEGRFLRDLYDRLAFEVIHVRPLRERAGDVEILARRFLAEFMLEVPAFQGKRLSAGALEALNRYDFPGNVRELKNIIERAVYRDTTNELTPRDLDMPAPGAAAHEGGAFREQVEALERRLIASALEEAGGNQARAARGLGLSYHQFRYYLKKYGS